jgi:hypothetical protein
MMFGFLLREFLRYSLMVSLSLTVQAEHPKIHSRPTYVFARTNRLDYRTGSSILDALLNSTGYNPLFTV